MRILGVDPGLQITGYGLIEAEGAAVRLVEGGVVRPDAGLTLERRLFMLHENISNVMAEFQPDSVVVEELYAKYAHPRTAILMGHARGTILLAAAQRGIPFCGYEASLVKRSLTGNGRATKTQVAHMVCHLLGLKEPPTPEDVTDALALALCHASPARQMFERPKGRRGLPEAIAKQL
ncbi:MAG: crossover junction endodeoxyribonuclease RuvC [Armatimonadetes bacterium]|nr:crossover junction endodeoxyribonuclease RuvC [Armatimonadota bacterium]